jgi:hypothetical protein
VRVKFSRIAGFTREDIKRWGLQHLSPGSTVYSDGLSCFFGIKDVGCRHQPIVTGSGKKAVQNLTFKWVNTMLGNLKNSLAGTYHAIRAGPFSSGHEDPSASSLSKLRALI